MHIKLIKTQLSHSTLIVSFILPILLQQRKSTISNPPFQSYAKIGSAHGGLIQSYARMALTALMLHVFA